MFSMKSVTLYPLIAIFQLSSADSLNLGWSKNGVLGNGLNPFPNKAVLLRVCSTSLKKVFVGKGEII